MANVKISELPLGIPTLAAEVPFVEGGVTRKGVRFPVLTTAQTTAGGTAVAALTAGNALLDASGATVLTKSGTATTFPGAVNYAGGTLTATLNGTNWSGTGWVSVSSFISGDRLVLDNANQDVVLRRGGPGILEQRNGTAAQRKRVFNTGDATSGEWFDIDWQTTPNVATIGARAAGTGTLRPVTAIGNWTFNSQIVLPFAGGVGSTTGAGDGEWYLVAASINRVSMSDYGLTNGANIPVAWSSSATPNRALRDVAVGRNAAGVLEINNGTAGQFRDLRLRSLIQQPPASITPASNGDLVFEATSNTSLTVKLRGSDGVVRSAVLTLS